MALVRKVEGVGWGDVNMKKEEKGIGKRELQCDEMKNYRKQYHTISELLIKKNEASQK